MIEILVAGVFVVLFAVLAVAVWVLNIQSQKIRKLNQQVNDDDEGFDKEAFDAKWGPPMSSES